MDLSVLSKICLILKYFFSSFLGIEMLLVGVIVCLFLIFNIKQKSLIIKIFVPVLLILILLFISGGFSSYVKGSVDIFIKSIMNYYYFPSISFYYIMTILSVIIIIYSLASEKITSLKKIINYIFMSIYFVMFLGVMSYIIKNNLELTFNSAIYQDDLILSFIQISNLLFLIWLVITCFWYLYKYLKRRFD